jgi:hypothetical protein
MTLYIKYLSDEPFYLLVSFEVHHKYGPEILGMLTIPDRSMPSNWGYAMGEEIIDMQYKLTPCILCGE